LYFSTKPTAAFSIRKRSLTYIEIYAQIRGLRNLNKEMVVAGPVHGSNLGGADLRGNLRLAAQGRDQQPPLVADHRDHRQTLARGRQTDLFQARQFAIGLDGGNWRRRPRNRYESGQARETRG
jgi:hypothetical protein